MTQNSPDVRLAVLERDMSQMQGALVSISESLSRLVALEERHAETKQTVGRLAKTIGDVDDRVSQVEHVMPQLIETRTWVLAMFGTILVAVGVAIIALVVK